MGNSKKSIPERRADEIRRQQQANIGIAEDRDYQRIRNHRQRRRQEVNNMGNMDNTYIGTDSEFIRSEHKHIIEIPITARK